MTKARYDRLKKAGWTVGTPAEFLGLTDEEAALIEMKLALAQSLREHRDAQNLTQEQLAKMLGSSQSRVAKMEAADSSVSMDLPEDSSALLKLDSISERHFRRPSQRPTSSTARRRDPMSWWTVRR